MGMAVNSLGDVGPGVVANILPQPKIAYAA